MRWVWGFILVIALAACSSTENRVQVLPISDLVEGALTISNFNNGTANLPITTKIPVACSIVYGTTPEFGSVAVDSDMAGGAHSAHNPLLTGLASNTNYYYRVQGVDEQGNIYVSDTMRFTSPDFAALNAESDNLALTATITGYSSIFGAGAVDSQWGANKAIDGNPATQWSSNGDGDAAWIELELVAVSQIDRIGFWTRTMGTSAEISSFQIVTEDGSIYGPFTVSDAEEVYYFAVDFLAQKLRFEVLSSSGGNTGAIEIEIYGSPQS